MWYLRFDNGESRKIINCKLHLAQGENFSREIICQSFKVVRIINLTEMIVNWSISCHPKYFDNASNEFTFVSVSVYDFIGKIREYICSIVTNRIVSFKIWSFQFVLIFLMILFRFKYVFYVCFLLNKRYITTLLSRILNFTDLFRPIIIGRIRLKR